MTRNNVWVGSLAPPVMIAILLLVAGSPRVAANDQPSAATAEVKIDNFNFGCLIFDQMIERRVALF